MTAPTSAPPSAPAPNADKPTKVLPTERVRFEKQIEVLRAYASISGQASKIVNVAEVAHVTSMNASTVSLCNGFFVDAHLLERAATGGFIPAPELMQFHRAYQWDKETAAQKLAPIFADMWFYTRLQAKLGLRSMTEQEAIRDLAEAAGATTKYQSQLRVLLEYLAFAGLIKREGDQIRLAPLPELDGPSSATEPQIVNISASDTGRGSSSATASAVTTAATTPTPGVHFSIEVSVSMADILTWDGPRITAFFEGVAKVLAAKSGDVG